MATEIAWMLCNRTKTIVLEDYYYRQLTNNYGCYSEALRADVFRLFNCTFSGQGSIRTCLSQANRDQIVGMLLVRQKQAIAAMLFGVSQSIAPDFARLIGKEVS